MRMIWATLLGLTVALCTAAQCAANAEKPADHAASSAAGGHGDHIGLANPGPNVEDPGEIKQDLAFFTFVVFLLLLAILWKFAWGPISAGLDKREQSIAEHIAAVQRSHDEAKQMLAEYEKKLAGAAGEVRELLEEARRDAEHTKQEIIAEGKKGAEAERARSLREIEAATDAALKQLADLSANLAVELAGKIVKHELKPADHARLVQEAVSKFTQPSPSKN